MTSNSDSSDPTDLKDSLNDGDFAYAKAVIEAAFAKSTTNAEDAKRLKAARLVTKATVTYVEAASNELRSLYGPARRAVEIDVLDWLARNTEPLIIGLSGDRQMAMRLFKAIEDGNLLAYVAQDADLGPIVDAITPAAQEFGLSF